MTGFKDIRLPVGVKGYPTSGAARWSTSIVTSASGAEHRNQNWRHPLMRYTLAQAVRDQETFEKADRHWRAMRGAFYGFPFLDPLDFASSDLPAANIAPETISASVVLGVGNASRTDFQLIKNYTATGDLETETYTRTITLPITETVVVTMNGLSPSTPSPGLPGGPYTWNVTRPGGVVTISPPPAAGVVVRAGFLFEVPVRFEADDTFEGVVRNYRVSGFADITLVELRPC